MARRSEWLCYTDGSCKAGDAGGWGFHLRPPPGGGEPDDAEPREGFGKAQKTLAKVMEYRAVAEALAALPEGAAAVVFSDNQALVENLGRKLRDWRASGFVNVDPQVRDEIRRIDARIVEAGLEVRFEWVRGHGKNAGNQRADALAAQGAREAKAETKAPARGRR